MGGLYAAALAGSRSLFLVLILAVAGVPPFLGFWPKLLLLQAALDGSGFVGGAIDWGAAAVDRRAAAQCAADADRRHAALVAHLLAGRARGRAGGDAQSGPAAADAGARPGWGWSPTLLLAVLVLPLGSVPGRLFGFGGTAAPDLLRCRPLYVEAVGESAMSLAAADHRTRARLGAATGSFTLPNLLSGRRWRAWRCCSCATGSRPASGAASCASSRWCCCSSRNWC